MPRDTRTNRARYWIFTINHTDWQPPTELPNGVSFIAGQLEVGEGGYQHWQGVIYFKEKKRFGTAKSFLCNTAHIEPTRSDAALDYVQKDDTSVEGTRFKLGTLPPKMSSAVDWESIRSEAKAGRLDFLPANIYVQHYRSLKQIAADNATADPTLKNVRVYWGTTGIGKSRRAWYEAGFQAYPKDPRTKWWCGYRTQKHIVMDEFRGGIDIAHMLRWLDRYPSLLETKGSTIPCSFTDVWITSNLHPRDWYPDLDELTKDALLRRLHIEEMTEPWTPPENNEEIDVNELISLL